MSTAETGETGCTVDGIPSRLADIHGTVTVQLRQPGRRAVVSVSVVGSRGGRRTAAVLIGSDEREAIIRALGGTP